MSIQLWICECDPRDPEVCHYVAGHFGVRLQVDEVFLDSLVTGRLWSIGVAGYNFRHVIRARRSNAFPKPGARYEIRYAFLPKDCGAAAIVRFHVRFNPT